MEENTKDDSGLDQFNQKMVEDGIKDILNEKELKIKWGKEIAANGLLQSYLESFNAVSVAGFISNYLNYKYIWHKYGAMYKNKVERDRSKWIDLAHEHLEPILQKQRILD